MHYVQVYEKINIQTQNSPKYCLADFLFKLTQI